MTIFTVTHPWAFAFGLLGNVISFAVYLAPLQTFYRIYKKKSTEGFQSIPYIVALFSSMLWMYYGFLKTGAYLLITINSFGCVIETIYIAMYLTYAPSKARILTTKLLLLLNLGGFSLILLLTVLLTEGQNRVHILGWVCVAFSVSVFVAPLSIMRLVIRTKSIEFMPFSLSFFLMISAVTWFAYGFLLKDIYIALPNVIGFVFGILQMVLYAIYKNKGKVVQEKQPEQGVNVIKLSSPNNVEECVVEIEDVDCDCGNNIDKDHQKIDEQVDSHPQYEMKFNQFEAQIPAIKA